MATNIAWGALDGGTGSSLLDYTPGVDEITNLGLLYTRAYITYDGPSSTEKVSTTLEQTLITTPTIANLTAAYKTTNADYILLPTKSKQLPGMEDAPTWNIMTDSTEELVGRTYAGKSESLSTLEFVTPAIPDLINLAISHQSKGSRFTLVQCYDDPNLSKLFYIVTPRCTLLGASTGSSENNSGGEYTLRFLPMGGIYVPITIEQARTSA